MKFYSEKTGFLYDTEEALNADEIKLAKKEKAQKEWTAEKKKKEDEEKEIAKKIKEIIDTINQMYALCKDYEKKLDEAEVQSHKLVDQFLNDYAGNTAAQRALIKGIKSNLKVFNTTSLFDWWF